MIESMHSGGFLSLAGEAVYQSSNELSYSSQQWDFSSRLDNSVYAPKKGSIHEVKKEVDL